MAEIITLSELTERWLDESLGVFSRETLEHYRSRIEAVILPYFGEATGISRELVGEFLRAKREEGLSETTIFPLVRLLERILQYGAAMGECPEPDWGLGLHTPQRKRGIVILPPWEERQVISFLTDNPSPMHLCIFLILTCGIGVSESLGLRWKDVSVANSFIRVSISRGPVTSRRSVSRRVPISERERIYLRKMMSRPEDYLSSGTSRPRQRAAMESRWRKIADALLLPPMSLMDLRHTFAVRCIEGGMDYETLSRRLGLENTGTFRRTYRSLVSEEQKERLERERFESRKVRKTPEHLTRGPRDPEATPYRQKIEKRREELKLELESLEGDLAIIGALRHSDCVQGANRQGLYAFVEKVLGDDKDGRYLVEYLRCNMRVAEMPLLRETTVQAIRRRVTHGFEKLNRRLEEIYAVEGWEAVPMLRQMCGRIEEIAPQAPKRTGPKVKPTLDNRVKSALEALERLKAENEALRAKVAEME